MKSIFRLIFAFFAIFVFSICAKGALVSLAGLPNPTEDKILFYDFSAKEYTWLTIGSGLSIVDTTLSSIGGGGGGFSWDNEASFVANSGHSHDFTDISNLPETNPRDLTSMSIPTGIVGNTLSHSITFAQAYYILKVTGSAQNYVMALLLEGVTPTDEQLESINSFYKWSDETGFISGQKSGARLLLTIWDNSNANMINLLNPSDTTTKARVVNSAGLFTEPGYIQTDMSAGSKGFLAFDTTSNSAWDTTDWSMAYYSHLGAQTADNAIIGGRDDGISSGSRYINTSTATVFRWSPGFAGGSIDYTTDTSATFGLLYVGYKGTKLDARKVKTGGTTVAIDSSGSYNAVLSNVPFLGFAYNGESGPTSFSGQPCSLFYIGRKIGDNATEATAIAEALYNLVIGCGAPEV